MGAFFTAWSASHNLTFSITTRHALRTVKTDSADAHAVPPRFQHLRSLRWNFGEDSIQISKSLIANSIRFILAPNVLLLCSIYPK
jgi:hypothetical protein